MTSLIKILKQHKGIFLLMTFLGLLTPVFEGLGIGFLYPILNPDQAAQIHSKYLWFINAMVNSVPPDNRRNIFIGLLLVSVLLKNLLLYGNQLLSSTLRHQVSHAYRRVIHRQIVELSVTEMEKQNPGQLLNLVGPQVIRIEAALSNVYGLVTGFSYMLVFTCMLLAISWRLTLMVAFLMVSASLTLRPLQKIIGRWGILWSTALGKMNNRFLESANAFREVRVFNRETYEAEQFEVVSHNVSTSALRLDALVALFSPISEVLSTAVLCVVLLFSVPVLFRDQGLGTAGLLTFLVLLYRLTPQVKGVETSRANLASELASLSEIAEFVSPAGKLYTIDGTRPFASLKVGLEFRDVSYAYAPDSPKALDSISLHIPANKTTAIVGPSGSGKTTLIGLIARFYEPDTGKILVDGVGLDELHVADWRDHIGMVSQHVFIFAGTVRDNIGYGRAHATDADIVRAAELANAHGFILDMPAGYDTLVGDLGVRLSGGQRQRIALARAILRNPSILILDEATSALDTLAERMVQEALAALGRDRTVVVIAHRLSTVQSADQIIVLQEGRVKETGTPEELLNQEGLYSIMYSLQLSPGIAAAKV